MSLAMTTGRCWQGLAASVPGYAPSPDDRTVLVGGHQLDEAERRLLDGPRPTWLTVADVRAGRAGSVLDRVLAHADAVHVHVDLDVHDTSLPPANSYAAPGGLTPGDVRATVLDAVTRLPLASATVASWDPTHDVDDRMRDAALGLLELLGTPAPAL